MSTQVSERSIPWGENGSLTTVAHMRALVHSAIRSPLVVERAHSIARQFAPRAHVRIALGIRDWLNSNFHFVRDPVGVELIRDPEYQLNQYMKHSAISGDCDDAAILGCALGMAVGIPCSFVAIGFDHGGQPGMLSHIYGVLYPTNDKGKRMAIPLDITKPAGAVASVRRRLEFPV